MRSFVIALALAGSACGSDSLTGLEGIYVIDAWNRNDVSCADPGPSVLGMEGQTHFYIKTETFFSKFVNVKACVSLAECEMQSSDDDTIHLGDFGTFEDGNDDDGWTQRSGYAFDGDGDGTCDGTVTTSTLTTDATGVVFREDQIDVMFPARTGEQDECPEDAALDAAQGQPCTQLEVVHGVLVQEL
jgi:hypothetical protein